MRTVSMTLSGLCLALAACGPSVPIPPPDGEDGWPIAPRLNNADYTLQDVSSLGLTGAELLPEAAAAIERQLRNTDPVEGNYTETLNVYEAPPQGAVIFTADSLADDSVRSMQYVVEFDLRPDSQVEGRVFAMPTGYGTRQRCWRAPDPDAWTNQPCL